ncbi:MAG: 50S ribosomal protein L20 [Candidatus Brocadiae bacterium]|nr:50S ribosomal protein L20 [Candidatus Brocadiia bacterium]
MPRVTIAPARKKRHKRVLKAAKGYYGARSRLYRTAKEAVLRANAFAYRDRRVRKREFRALWITRVGAAARERGLSYNVFMHGLSEAGVGLNRKMLAEIAVADPAGFDKLVEIAKG